MAIFLLTSLNVFVNVLIISACCRLSSISLLTTPISNKRFAQKKTTTNDSKFWSTINLNWFPTDVMHYWWKSTCYLAVLRHQYLSAAHCLAWNWKDNLFNFDPCPSSGGCYWSLTFTSTGLNNEVDEDQQAAFLVLFVAVEPLIHHCLLNGKQPMRTQGLDKEQIYNID